MAAWLYEEGIGENRAIRVEQGEIVEAVIELPGTAGPGAVVEARLIDVQQPGRRGLVRLDSGDEAILTPIPAGVTEGATLRVEVVREPLPETGRAKRAKVRPSDAPLRPAPPLAERIGGWVPSAPGRIDMFEQAGWSELIESAETGEISFAGGALRMSLTPAMTLFDVDGVLEPAALAVAGARAAGQAIRRFAIGGSIGIDLPTLPAKADRLKAAEALDAVLPQPFERTAVNGFGFLQVVRRRERRSIPEIVQADPVGSAARALLRRAERAGPGALLLVAAPAVTARIEAEQAWVEALQRRIGGAIALQADAGQPISAGYVHHRQS
ncbi:ribonuclease [Sphingosinicella sp. YJ22]|uniref:ribonuclease n=1 Tax=Sphingosinicella sp. YJ22 TaxID=1104780 RepID=UPI00140C7FE5|nr:ribonuclease [Sphingosinicella sp. YJ22]